MGPGLSRQIIHTSRQPSPHKSRQSHRRENNFQAPQLMTQSVSRQTIVSTHLLSLRCRRKDRRLEISKCCSQPLHHLEELSCNQRAAIIHHHIDFFRLYQDQGLGFSTICLQSLQHTAQSFNRLTRVTSHHLPLFLLRQYNSANHWTTPSRPVRLL
jgi:hypothetical protein